MRYKTITPADLMPSAVGKAGRVWHREGTIVSDGMAMWDLSQIPAWDIRGIEAVGSAPEYTMHNLSRAGAPVEPKVPGHLEVPCRGTFAGYRPEASDVGTALLWTGHMWAGKAIDVMTLYRAGTYRTVLLDVKYRAAFDFMSERGYSWHPGSVRGIEDRIHVMSGHDWCGTIMLINERDWIMRRS